MPLSRRAVQPLKLADLPLSYKVGETRDRLTDCRNIISNQGRVETRNGYSRFIGTSLGGSVLSLSYFKNTANSRFYLAKSGTVLYRLSTPTGAHTSLQTGLSVGTKHRGITLNNRHIVAIEGDGLFSYDGTTFTQLGQDPPSAPTVATTGGSLTDSTYQVALTFEASGIGFETNQGAASSNVTTSSQGISVTAIPTTAANDLIDKVNVYLKDVTANSEFLFVEQLNLGTSSTTITSDPTSTQVPPTKNAAPLSGGGKYLAEFNEKLVYAGNSTFKNDVFFSEANLPDAFDDSTSTRLVLNVPGDGDITGLATGLYNDSTLDPYLVIFKKSSTHIYSEIGGNAKFLTLHTSIGCISHDTITVRNGDVFFMSQNGWRGLTNGELIRDANGNVITLGNNDIDDIFTSQGFDFQLNSTDYLNFHSVYYSILDQYLTFVSEGSSSSKNKAYNFEFNGGRFKVFEFPLSFVSSSAADDSDDDPIVLFGDSSGFVYSHSIKEDRHDVDASNSSVSISAFFLLPWLDGEDFDATFNYRELILRALASTNNDKITVRAWRNFTFQNTNLYEYEFPDPASGFVLDVSKLDEGIFSDGRTIVTARDDINMTAESLLIGFYQDILDANMNLISAQIHFNKNGNRNL